MKWPTGFIGGMTLSGVRADRGGAQICRVVRSPAAVASEIDTVTCAGVSPSARIALSR